MANGNGGVLTPTKVLVTCITITVMINGYTLQQLNARTDERYRVSDNVRDHNYVNFRFQRNEQLIQECVDHIRGHEHDE